MKKLLALLLAAVMVLSLAACGGSGKTTETKAPAAPAASGGPISLTLWGAEEDQALLAELVEKFKAQYPDQTFDIKIGVESESTAKDTVLTDVEAAADVFAFANDQLNDLVSAGALLALDGDIAQVGDRAAEREPGHGRRCHDRDGADRLGDTALDGTPGETLEEEQRDERRRRIHRCNHPRPRNAGRARPGRLRGGSRTQ